MNIHLTPQDFDLLRENDMAWSRELQTSARFTAVLTTFPSERATGICVANPWKRIWWFGREYSAVILARTFLEAYGHDYEVLRDHGHEWDSNEEFGYVILTDYEREE